MTRFRDLDARQAALAYFASYLCHSGPPSLMSRDLDMPASGSTAPPSGRREELIWVVRGVPDLAMQALALHLLGTEGPVWIEVAEVPAGWDPVEYMATPEDQRPRPYMGWQQVPSRPSFAAVGRALQVSAAEARQLVARALGIIAENLGRERAGEEVGA